MLEGMIVMIFTMFLLVWILGLGFLYYQRYLLTAVTNDAAAKVAATYNNPDSDLVIGYISSGELSDRDLYRNFNNNSLFEINRSKAEAYIKYKLNATNFAGTIDSVNVTMSLEQDSVFRKHIKLITQCTFNTPFGGALDFFGMNGHITYEAAARADCTDIMDYVSTVDFVKYQTSFNWLEGKKTKKLIKMLNSLIKMYNHIYTQ